MNEITKILRAAENGVPDEIVTEKLLPLLSQEDPDLAKIVNLRYFAGMTVTETAAALGVSPSTGDRQWACARTWLLREITEGKQDRP